MKTTPPNNTPQMKPEVITPGSSTPSPRAMTVYERFQHDYISPDKTQEQINTAWNEYYVRLTDAAKMELWQEYYVRRQKKSFSLFSKKAHQPKHIGDIVVSDEAPPISSFFTVKGQLRSIAFGLASAALVVAVPTFVLFNERFVTPFIRPGTSFSIPPVVDQTGAPVDTSPRVRIPKISVEIPVVYDLTSTDDQQFELALDRGVVHYPTTVLPGQNGNAAFFGHSSNNIFNPGKYKFAFVLLHELAIKDSFYLTHDGKLYEYEVISTKIVKPTEVGVLGSVDGQVATATLITCDPPGTSNNRLIVVGKQISPDPSTNGVPPVVTTPDVADPSTTNNLPGNGPGLLTRLWRSVF